MDDLISLDPCAPVPTAHATESYVDQLAELAQLPEFAPRRHPPRAIGPDAPWRDRSPPHRHYHFNGRWYNLDRWNTNKYEGVNLQELPTEELQKLVELSKAKVMLYEKDLHGTYDRLGSPVSHALPGTPLALDAFRNVPRKVRDRYKCYQDESGMVQTLPWVSEEISPYRQRAIEAGDAGSPRPPSVGGSPHYSPRCPPSVGGSPHYSPPPLGSPPLFSPPPPNAVSPIRSPTATSGHLPCATPLRGTTPSPWDGCSHGVARGEDCTECLQEAVFDSEWSHSTQPPLSRSSPPMANLPLALPPQVPSSSQLSNPWGITCESQAPTIANPMYRPYQRPPTVYNDSSDESECPSPLRAPPAELDFEFITPRPPSPPRRRSLHELPPHKLTSPHLSMADAQKRHGAGLRSGLYSGPQKSQLPKPAGASTIASYSPQRRLSISPTLEAARQARLQAIACGGGSPGSSPGSPTMRSLTTLPAHKVRSPGASMAQASQVFGSGLRESSRSACTGLPRPTGASVIPTYRERKGISSPSGPRSPQAASPCAGVSSRLTAVPAHRMREAPESMAAAQAAAGRGLRESVHRPASPLPKPCGPSQIPSFTPQRRLSAGSGAPRTPCSNSSSRLTALPAHRMTDPFASMASGTSRLSSGLRESVHRGPQRCMLGTPTGPNPGTPRGTRAHPYPSPSTGSPLPLADISGANTPRGTSPNSPCRDRPKSRRALNM